MHTFLIFALVISMLINAALLVELLFNRRRRAVDHHIQQLS